MRNVLIAGGLPGERELLRILLGHEGYEVIEAMDFTEAVAMARARLPDLILVDLDSQGNGYRAVEEMRLDELHKDRAILAVTDSTLRADRERLVKAGFSGYIAKPVVLRNLREQLTQLSILQPEA